MMQCVPLIKVGKAIEQAVTSWEAQHGQISGSLTLAEANFVRQKQGLLASMDGAARKFI